MQMRSGISNEIQELQAVPSVPSRCAEAFHTAVERKAAAESRAGGKVRMNDHLRYAGLRALLESKRSELNFVLAHREEIEAERHADRLDAVWAITVRQTAARVLTRETALLRQVEAALERLRVGTFGICEGCGYCIPVKRMEAVPWALYCIRCQEEADEAERDEVGEGPA